jgi:hypothetical protein
MLIAMLAMTFPVVALADVDCELIAPPGVTKTKEGDVQAQLAADTILKAAKVGGDIKASAKSSLATAQKNAPSEDPDSLKARTLYVFCGMVANAKDVTTAEKFKMLKELEKVPSPPGQPPNEKDGLTKLGLPRFGASKDEVEAFAAPRKGVWRYSQGKEYVDLDDSLSDQPTLLQLFISSNKLYEARWSISSQRQHTTFGGKPDDDDSGPDPATTCSSFVDKLQADLVSEVGFQPGGVSVTKLPVSDAWAYIPGGRPPLCDQFHHIQCQAHASRTDREATLASGTQSFAIHASYVMAFGSTDGALHDWTWNDRYCDLTVTARKKSL